MTENIVIYSFLITIFISFIKLIIIGDSVDKVLQKTIGGLGVFVMALISKNPYIIFTSLFIGGLIIASEKFMQSLAAIIKTDSNSMPSTIEALNKSVDISPASAQEIKAENDKENETDIKLSSQNKNNRLNSILSREKRNTLQLNISNYLSEKYKNHFTKDLKLENEYGHIVVDGAVHYSADAGKLNLENILGLVEIEYVSNVNNFFIFEYKIREIMERIRYLFINKQVLIIFYGKGLNKEQAMNLENKLNEKYPRRNGKKDIVFGFFNLSDENEIAELFLPELGDHVI